MKTEHKDRKNNPYYELAQESCDNEDDYSEESNPDCVFGENNIENYG